MDVALFVISYVLFIGFYTYESLICMTWKPLNGKLELKCKLDNLDLRISFTDPDGNERAYCLLPFPESDCYSHSQNDRIKQDLSTNETTIVVGEISRSTVNGTWSCFHGTNNEMSSVHVTEFKAEHTPAFINLIAPKYVKTNEKFVLDCSSSITPINFTAHIFVNGLLYTKLQRQSNGCWSSTKHSLCSEPACECSSDGHTYSVEYNGLPYEGTLTFSCQMDLPDVGLISDCKFVRICEDMELLLQSKKECEMNSTVNITCNVSGQFLRFGFAPWIHQVNGVFIRVLHGTLYDQKSVIQIESCNIEDAGDYLCRAWNEFYGERTWYTKQSTLVFKGPPVILDSWIYRQTHIILSVKYYSLTNILSTRWYFQTSPDDNTTHLTHTVSRKTVLLDVYGKIVPCEGFVANLSMPDDFFPKSGNVYTVILENEFGNTTKEFTGLLRKVRKSAGFQLYHIFWTVIVTAVCVVIFAGSNLMCYLNRYRNGCSTTSRSIYYAAPASDEPVQVYNIRMSDNLQQNSINNESGGGYIDVVNDYEEIDKDEIECQSIQDSPHYLELD